MYVSKKVGYSIFCCTLDEKKNHEILTALHYKLLYNINRRDSWLVKKLQNRANVICEWPLSGTQPIACHAQNLLSRLGWTKLSQLVKSSELDIFLTKI